jgi:acyl dehydratase
MAQSDEAAVSPREPIQIDVADLSSHAGETLGTSSWWTITQEQVNSFADATGDHQWIHVDPERAKSGPFGTTIAHGFMTLGMVVGMLFEVIEVTGAGMILNYGVNKVRFPAPLPVGSRIRAGIVLAEVEDVPGGVQVIFRATVEIEGAPKPACAADIVFRYYQTAPQSGATGRA